MQPFDQFLEGVSAAVWQASWQAACLALMIWGLDRTLGARLAAGWRFALWSLVFVRLALPVVPASPTSVFRLWPARPEQAAPVDAEAENVRFASRSASDDSVQTADAQSPLAATPVPHDDTAETAVNLTQRALQLPPIARNSRWNSTTAWRWGAIAVWGLGITVLGIRRGVQQRSLARRMKSWRLPQDPRIESLLTACCRRIGIRSRVNVLVSDDDSGPAITGMFRARIVLPETLLREFSDEQLEMILLHELAHVRRRDLLVRELLIWLRSVHWFNPAAWWVFLRMEIERENACDELVLDVTGADRRLSYGMTLLEVVKRISTQALSPGLLGISNTSATLQRRLAMIRDYRKQTWKTNLLAVALIAAAMAVGLTSPPDAITVAAPQTAAASTADDAPQNRPDGKQAETASNNPEDRTSEPAAEGSLEIKGVCHDGDDHPLPGAEVALYRLEYYGGAPTQLWSQKSDAKGAFRFGNLRPIAESDGISNIYVLGARQAKHTSYLRIIRDGDFHKELELKLSKNTGALSGRVTNEQGVPLAGAEVYLASNPGLSGFMHAVTDEAGRYSIPDLGCWNAKDQETYDPKTGIGKSVWRCYFCVRHPDYPITRGAYSEIPQEVNVQMEPGMRIDGRVLDDVTREPAAGVLISAQEVNPSTVSTKKIGGNGAFVMTDSKGTYRLSLTEGQYNIRAQAKDRTCIALDSFSGPVGKTTEAPDLKLIPGGFIAGKVVDKTTGKPLSKLPGGQQMHIAHYGPAFPKSGAAVGAATIAEDGSYQLRVAPGANFPYLMHDVEAERTPRNLLYLPPIMVSEGETVTLDFHVGEAAEPRASGLRRSPRSRPAAVLSDEANDKAVPIPKAVPEKRKPNVDVATDLMFTETPLKDALLFIAELHKLRLSMDEEAIRKAGVDSNSPVSLQVSEVTLRSVLHLMLKPLKLTFIVDEDALKITSIAAAGAKAAAPAAPGPQEERIRKALFVQKDVKFVAKPLDVALESLKVQYGINIWMDEDTIRDSGVALDAPVDLKISAASLHDVLHLILNRLNLTYLIEDEVLKITTVKAARAAARANPMPMNARINRALGAPTDVVYVETPLKDALLFLKDQHNIPIKIDAGVAVADRVTLQPPVGVTLSLRSVLNLLLRSRKLTYVVENEELRITPIAPDAPPPVSTPSPVDARIRKQLEAPTEVEFVELPLSDALRFLQDMHQIYIWLDEDALRKAKVSTTVPVTLQLSAIPLKSVFKLLLEPLTLTYIIEDDVLKVTTVEAARAAEQEKK